MDHSQANQQFYQLVEQIEPIFRQYSFVDINQLQQQYNSYYQVLGNLTEQRLRDEQRQYGRKRSPILMLLANLEGYQAGQLGFKLKNDDLALMLDMEDKHEELKEDIQPQLQALQNQTINTDLLTEQQQKELSSTLHSVKQMNTLLNRNVLNHLSKQAQILNKAAHHTYHSQREGFTASDHEWFESLKKDIDLNKQATQLLWNNMLQRFQYWNEQASAYVNRAQQLINYFQDSTIDASDDDQIIKLNELMILKECLDVISNIYSYTENQAKNLRESISDKEVVDKNTYNQHHQVSKEIFDSNTYKALGSVEVVYEDFTHSLSHLAQKIKPLRERLDKIDSKRRGSVQASSDKQISIGKGALPSVVTISQRAQQVISNQNEDEARHDSIGSNPGDPENVAQASSQLPPSITPADLKMYKQAIENQYNRVFPARRKGMAVKKDNPLRQFNVNNQAGTDFDPMAWENQSSNVYKLSTWQRIKRFFAKLFKRNSRNVSSTAHMHSNLGEGNPAQARSGAPDDEPEQDPNWITNPLNKDIADTTKGCAYQPDEEDEHLQQQPEIVTKSDKKHKQ